MLPLFIGGMQSADACTVTIFASSRSQAFAGMALRLTGSTPSPTRCSSFFKLSGRPLDDVNQLSARCRRAALSKSLSFRRRYFEAIKVGSADPVADALVPALD
jgi:hypothetical protein